MSEIWKDIPEYEGSYQASNLGRIKSFKRFPEKIVGEYLIKGGYCRIPLHKNGVKHKLVHRLIALAFIPNPENKKTINHKNGNPSDNRVKNLEWATQGENNLHAYRELNRKPHQLGKSGKDHHRSKSVLQFTKEGKFVCEHESICMAFKKTNIHHISHVCLGKQKTAGGFLWKFKQENEI